MTLAREPLQIVELDISYCRLTYGQTPCNASLGRTGQRKCFNTFATCQDRANFDDVQNRDDRSTLTLSFAKNQSGLPGDRIVYPCLQSVKTSPTEITLGGSPDRRKSPLGRRARVTIQLKDFTDSDNQVDKYADERRLGAAQTDEGGYEPQERGTFFAKLRARHPYYNNRAIRVRNGYVGDRPEDMPTRHYIATEWRGPDSNGNVTIIAQDILALLGTDKAVCPRPSLGTLAQDLDESTNFTNTAINLPQELGGRSTRTLMEEYPLRFGTGIGLVAIDSEVISYDFVNSVFPATYDFVNGTPFPSGINLPLSPFRLRARGLEGTQGESHEAGADVQWVFREVLAPPERVIFDLLTNYAGIPENHINRLEWANELGYRFINNRTPINGVTPFPLLTTVVTKPTPVLTLINEICALGLIMYVDENVSPPQIRLERVRPLADIEAENTIRVFTDDDTFIEGTLQAKDLYDQRLSQVLVYNGVINATGSRTSRENYRNLQAAVDLQAEGPFEYDETQTLTITTPWLGTDIGPPDPVYESGNSEDALTIATQLLRRYRDTPKQLIFTADIKDREALRLASYIRVSTRVLENEIGEPDPITMQVTGVEEVDSGNRIKVTAQSFL